MPLDPNIALQVGQPVQPLDPMKAYGQVLTLKNLMDQQQNQGLQAEAMRAKMGRDAEDQLYQSALNRTKVLSKYAAGFQQVPPEQRANIWPVVRQRLAAEGVPDMPEEMPDENLISVYASLERSPDKMAEVAQQEAQRRALAEAQRSAIGATTLRAVGGNDAPGGVSEPTETPGGITMPTNTVTATRSFSMDPSYHWRVADAANKNPLLAGTKYAEDATNMALKIEKDTRDAEGAGLQYIKGEDGQTYVFRNGKLEGAATSTGRDPNALFWAGEDGNPVPNTAAQDYGVRKSKAGATSVNVQNNPVPLGKAAETKVDEGLLDTSATLMRLNGIRKQYKPEWSEFSTQAGMKLNQLGEKYLGVKVAPAAQEKFKQYTQWRQKATNNLNLTIKSLTGAAMSDSEAERIKSTLPTADDSPSEFQAKMEGAETDTKMALARLTYIKRNRGMSIADIPLEAMPEVMRARDREIEGEVLRRYPNMDPAERNDLIKRQLAQEFGLIGK